MLISNLLNVLLQIIEALVCFSFYENVSYISNKKISRLIIILVSYLIMGAINLIFFYNIVINSIIMLLFHFLFSFVLYKNKLKNSLFYSILIPVLIAVTELLVVSILSVFFDANSKDYISDPFQYTLVIIFSKSLLFLSLKIIGELINRYSESKKIDFIFFIYPISMLLILIDFIIIFNQFELSNKIKFVISFSSILLMLTIIITCILQQQSAKKEAELLELKALNQEQELNNTYFELLEHQNEELQIFVHDMKDHFRTIFNLADNPEKIREYAQGIYKDIDNTNQIGKTSNKLLDFIIGKYNFACQKNNIEFEKNIHNSDFEFIEDRDLSSIFNNLFDNAVEAAKKSEKKYITFGLNKINNMLAIDITNSCDTPPVTRKNRLMTTKENKKLHGYGFKSICRTVKKYNGDIEWEYDNANRSFTVSIIFAVKDTE
ncbi:MAG: GHKL domain-containing protein [Eubacterium sp.]|nr:GHKL domain-containing protein [Eubacterium sp.]